MAQSINSTSLFIVPSLNLPAICHTQLIFRRTFFGIPPSFPELFRLCFFSEHKQSFIKKSLHFAFCRPLLPVKESGRFGIISNSKSDLFGKKHGGASNPVIVQYYAPSDPFSREVAPAEIIDSLGPLPLVIGQESPPIGSG